jgi:DNA-damage-inducible protein D
MNQIKKYTTKLFEDIKHIDEFGNEYWLARELMSVLEYSKWENFHKVIKQSMIACNNSGVDIYEQFPEVGKLSINVNGGQRMIVDYKLSRYACYLIAQNGNSRKKAIALAQTYFAIQTRKQELSEREYCELSEDEKRLYQRDLTRKGNHSLNIAAKNAGVKNFDKFHNSGYKGLYNGETADDIAKRKGLRYREDILDNMGSVELAANLFRITQTEEKIINDNIKNEGLATEAHYIVGKNIREVIAKNGGTMPEDLPTPKKSLKELEKEQINRFLNNKGDENN